MPSINWNREQWGSLTNWSQFGEGWSSQWGGVSMQWYGTILPRIHAFVPSETILEIACGFGRWTQFLKDLCDKMIAIDMVDKCVEACKVRFASSLHVSCFLNDGKSLDMVDDDSVDFVFSFDSLVHADTAVMQSYISQLPRILKKDGVAFLHHSNLGEYSYYQWITRVRGLRGVLGRIGILERNLHNRDLFMSARMVEEFAKKHGLNCISQELVNWRTKRALFDCFSILTKEDSRPSGCNRILRNSKFNKEVKQLGVLSSLYGKEDCISKK
jgi:SAM-dependent methyltransferase